MLGEQLAVLQGSNSALRRRLAAATHTLNGVAADTAVLRMQLHALVHPSCAPRSLAGSAGVAASMFVCPAVHLWALFSAASLAGLPCFVCTNF